MRITTLLKKLLGIKQTIVEGFEIVNGVLVIKVKPTWRKRRCSRCGKIRPGFDTLGTRYWRHLDFGGVGIYLKYALRRVQCRSCGVVVEKVPWSVEPKSRFTTDFEESVGHLAMCCDKTSVQEVFGIAWRTVGTIVKRVYKRHCPEDPLEGLKNIKKTWLSKRPCKPFGRMGSRKPHCGCLKKIWASTNSLFIPVLEVKTGSLLRFSRNTRVT